MNKQIYEKLKKNSIGENETQKVSNVKKRKILVKSVVPLIVIFAIFSACSLNSSVNYTDKHVEEQFTYDSLIVYDNLFKYTDDTKSKMYLAHLMPSESHSIEEYKTLNLTDQDIFSIYMFTTNNKKETEKAIKALGYNDWNDYLIKQHCVDDNNKPSFSLWLNRWYQKIYDSVGKVK